MTSFLKKIIAATEEDLRKNKKNLPLSRLKKEIIIDQNNFFYRNLFSSRNDPAIIAEIKFASPSAGQLADSSTLILKIKEYESASVDAISVITEPRFFKGSLDFIKITKQTVSLPVLMKDFIIDEYQIYQAKKAGADALLLIARLVDSKKLSRFVDLCLKLKIEPVVEIYSDEELEKVLNLNIRFIAVNSRDLDTFIVDVEKACRLMNKIPRKFLKLGFSGINSFDQVAQYKKAGARAILIGTSLMQASDIKKFITTISQPSLDKVKVKICGIKDLDSARTAIDAGADYIGFNFVNSSKRFIEPEKALKIINKIRGKIKIVGVFQDEAVDRVNQIAKNLKLDFVQLHGQEDLSYIKKITSKIIKKVGEDFIPDKKNLEKLNYLLIDRPKQGLGKMVDSGKAKEISAKFSSFIAGGLTPENVASVVKKIKPFAVDVAGGVETEGKKDLKKIKEFIKNAKNP